MRAPRILVLVLAAVLAATVAPSASARVDQPSASAVAQPGPAERAAADIVVTSKVVKKRLRPDRPRQLVLVGSVNPPKGPVYIQKATRCNRDKGTCNFTFYRKVYLKQGRYQAVIDAPPRLRSWLWRAKVKTTYSEIWQTCTKRPAQDCQIPD